MQAVLFNMIEHGGTGEVLAGEEENFIIKGFFTLHPQGAYERNIEHVERTG